MSFVNRKIVSLGLLALSLGIAGACSSADTTSPVSTSTSVTPKLWVNENGGAPHGYTVRAFTTSNGQLWSQCTNSTSSWGYYTHDYYYSPGVLVTFKDSINTYNLDGACQGSHYYNGGWVAIYEVINGTAQPITSVDANNVSKYIKYDGAMRTVRLDATGYSGVDGRTCTFVQFDGYPYYQSSITVDGDGELPLAFFECHTS